MADRTVNRRYIFPECDPPLVKDRSDIRYLKSLADNVNADANSMSARILEFLEEPDAARIIFGGVIAVPGTGSNGVIFRMPYNSASWDNTAGSIDLSAQGLRVLERGIYMFVSVVRNVTGGEQGTMVRHVRNGLTFQEGRRLEGPAGLIGPVETNMTTSDIMICQAGDLIQTQVKVIDGGVNMTMEARLAMIQLVKLDV